MSHPDRDELTADPRLYGFHATLKPPMRLNHGWFPLLEDAEALAARIAPFPLPPLHVTDLGGFLALRETTPCPALHTLADTCVTGLDAHRVPPDAAEIARRRLVPPHPAAGRHAAGLGLSPRPRHLALPHDTDPAPVPRRARHHPPPRRGPFRRRPRPAPHRHRHLPVHPGRAGRAVHLG